MEKNKSFRLPRKIRKKLKKTIWLYPPDKNGGSLMAWPTHSQEDYNAVKQGVVRDIMAESTKAKRKQEKKILDKEVIILDEQLKSYVEKVFEKESRNSSYLTLIEAKKTQRAKVAYYNFINAYHLVESGKESYETICFMSVDVARDLLKQKKTKKK
ncbi:MAG TPA: hypothetical protein DCG75_13790 [Bacteroidales bacterium]|nr:hypothetical protein [Bacteroidales bacterium]